MLHQRPVVPVQWSEKDLATDQCVSKLRSNSESSDLGREHLSIQCVACLGAATFYTFEASYSSSKLFRSTNSSGPLKGALSA